MSIIRMVEEGTPGATIWNGSTGDDRKVWIVEEHVGKCLFESEANGRDDSDFYMTYWDDETNAPKKVMFASTRGWTYPCYGSKPDATPEVVAKYEAWKKADDERRAALAAEAEAKIPKVDRRVRFVRNVNGRKNRATKGAEGVVFWRGVNKFKASRYLPGFLQPHTVGVEFDDGSRGFFDDKAVEVVR